MLSSLLLSALRSFECLKIRLLKQTITVTHFYNTNYAYLNNFS